MWNIMSFCLLSVRLHYIKQGKAGISVFRYSGFSMFLTYIVRFVLLLQHVLFHFMLSFFLSSFVNASLCIMM